MQTDSSRIREKLGYDEMITPDEGLEKTIAWERENPPPNIDESHFNYKAEDSAFEYYKVNQL